MSRRTASVAVNATADGDNTLITGVSGKTIRVLAYHFMATADTAATIVKSGASGTEHGRFAVLAKQGCSAGDGEHVLFECDKSADLVVNNPAGVDTLGRLTYEIS